MKKEDPDKKWYHIEGFTDKDLHELVGTLGFIFSLLAVSFFLPDIRATYVASGIVLFAGITKELYDLWSYGRFDWLDLLATIKWPFILSGTAAATALILKIIS